MKLYSSTLLTWPQVLHLFQAGRLYPGRWQNYYFYKVLKVDPLLLYTHSPLSHLMENRQYYCYNKYHRVPREEQGNKFVVTQMNEVQKDVWFPVTAQAEDLLVVHDSNLSGFPQITFPNYHEFS